MNCGLLGLIVIHAVTWAVEPAGVPSDGTARSPDEPATLWVAEGPVPESDDIARIDGVAFHTIKPRQPEVDGASWHHGVALVSHRGRLFASWGQNAGAENTAGEAARFRISEDGGRTWGPVGSIAAGEGADEAVSHGVFLSTGEELWAFHGAFRDTLQDVHTQAYQWNSDARIWEGLGQVIGDGFWPMQVPRRMEDGNWIMAGVRVRDGYGGTDDPPAVAISRGDDLLTWDLVVIPKPDDLAMWGESAILVDGPRIRLIARWREPVALVAESRDYGRTWTGVRRTDLPMAASKPDAGTLPDGTRYLINTIAADTGNRRAPLTIALGMPGAAGFSSLLKVRDAVEPVAGGSHPRSSLAYPASIVQGGQLLIGYSADAGRGGNRNSLELAVVPLDALDPGGSEPMDRADGPPDDGVMLDLPATGTDPEAIDFAQLPVLPGRHAIVTRGEAPWRFRLHSYLAHHDGRFWCLWSHGPRVEDHPTQHLRYATSPDGLDWSAPDVVVGPSPRDGFRYIARGLWVRDGELLALGSHDEAYRNGRVHFFGPSLALQAFRWEQGREAWRPLGVAFDDAINNFPPKRLPDDRWAMTRRDHENNVSLLVGGVESPLDWEAYPISGNRFEDGGRPEEPVWYGLPDGRLVGLFRDNAGSKRLYRAYSEDDGRTWTRPVRTNFPDATSKLFPLRLSDGTWVLISNANPAGRRPLCLATSEDGVVFTRLARLPIPGSGTLQYPHAIEQDGRLLIAYSRDKTAIEVVAVPLDAIADLRASGAPR